MYYQVEFSLKVTQPDDTYSLVTEMWNVREVDNLLLELYAPKLNTVSYNSRDVDNSVYRVVVERGDNDEALSHAKELIRESIGESTLSYLRTLP